MNQLTPMDRNLAVIMKLHKYIPLQPCKHGHIDFRITTTNACCACAKLAQRRQLQRKHGSVVEIRVLVAKGDEDAVINTAKTLAALRGLVL